MCINIDSVTTYAQYIPNTMLFFKIVPLRITKLIYTVTRNEIMDCLKLEKQKMTK